MQGQCRVNHCRVNTHYVLVAFCIVRTSCSFEGQICLACTVTVCYVRDGIATTAWRAEQDIVTGRHGLAPLLCIKILKGGIVQKGEARGEKERREKGEEEDQKARSEVRSVTEHCLVA